MVKYTQYICANKHTKLENIRNKKSKTTLRKKEIKSKCKGLKLLW